MSEGLTKPGSVVGAGTAVGATGLPRTIGFLGACGVMIGVIIGSGIFKTPTSIAAELGSPWVILGFWVAGGVLALFGALTYSELATMHPQSGGIYVFLREAFGRPVAFIFGWTYMLITKPYAAAGIAVVFSEHVSKLLSILLGIKVASYMEPQLFQTLLTCGVIILLTFINAVGTRLGTGVATFLTAIKIGALVFIILGTAVVVGLPAGTMTAVASPSTLALAVVPVMAAICWTYDGWSDIGAVAGEVKDPQRNLPRIYLVGTLAVTVIYVLVNLAYFAIVPIQEMQAIGLDAKLHGGTATLAPLVAERLIGSAGEAVIAMVVVVSTLGSTHSSIMTGARVTYQQACDGLIFRFLSGVDSKRKTPHVALWVQCGLSCVATIYAGSFEQLAGGFVFTMWIFYGMGGLALFVLRRTQADRPRAFKCPGYPVLPGLFVLSALGMTVLSIYQAWQVSPWWNQTYLFMIVLVAGLPVYFVWERLVGARRGSEARA